MVRQSPKDRAEQMLRSGFGIDDIVAEFCDSKALMEERRSTREWANGIRLDMRRAQEYADLGRMER